MSDPFILTTQVSDVAALNDKAAQIRSACQVITAKCAEITAMRAKWDADTTVDKTALLKLDVLVKDYAALLLAATDYLK